MEPYLLLERTPATFGQTFPYLYLEPGISDVGFASVTIDIIDKTISITAESVDGFDVCI